MAYSDKRQRRIRKKRAPNDGRRKDLLHPGSFFRGCLRFRGSLRPVVRRVRVDAGLIGNSKIRFGVQEFVVFLLSALQRLPNEAHSQIQYQRPGTAAYLFEVKVGDSPSDKGDAAGSGGSAITWRVLRSKVYTSLQPNRATDTETFETKRSLRRRSGTVPPDEAGILLSPDRSTQSRNASVPSIDLREKGKGLTIPPIAKNRGRSANA